MRDVPNCDLIKIGDDYVCSHCQWETQKANVKRNCPKRDRVIGVGDEFKAILESMGVTQGGCRCGSIQRQMNRMGPDKCEAEIVDMSKAIREEAIKRNWPLSSTRLALWAIEGLIRKAIKRVRARDG